MYPAIKHETPSQRRHFRVNAPISIVVDGTAYDTLNWSVIDFKLLSYAGDRNAGDSVFVELVVPYQGFEVRFPVKARITGIDASAQTLTGEFIDVDTRQKEILEIFVAGLIRGEMESFEGIIRRMDLPVTPVSLKPEIPLTAQEIAQQERRRRFGGALYIAAGILFSIALMVVVYTNLFQIKIRTAAMASPTDIILSPATGVVKSYSAKEREKLEAGALMISFEDPQLEKEIQRASLKLEEALIGAGKSKTDPNAKPIAQNTQESDSARASVRAMEANVSVMAKSVSRLKGLLAQGLTRKDVVDKAEADYYQAQSELNEARQRLGQLSQKSTDKLSLLSIAEGEYTLLKEERERLSMHAPASGSLLTYLIPQGASVRYGDPVAIFQHESPRYVEAFLTREEAMDISAGQEARVHFPSYNHTALYSVEEIDYASQLIGRRDGRYTLEQAGLTRDVRVKLSAAPEEDTQALNRIVPGTSAVVVFSRSLFGN